MSLASTAAVIRELQAGYADYGFTTQLEFEEWIQDYLDWYGAKILEWVGATNYVGTNLDVVDAEIYLTCARMLVTAYGKSAADAEAGWAIGSLRINQSSIAQKGVKEAASEYRLLAMGKLSPYMSHTFNRVKVLNPTEEEEIVYPADRFYLRQAT